MMAEKTQLEATSSSFMALKSAVSVRKFSATLKNFYGALITSITASTFKFAGQFTLALYCGEVLKDDVLALLGPVSMNRLCELLA
jgi:hypothetical protein